MFTDGLDQSAVAWVQGDPKVEKGVSPILEHSIDVLSPTLAKENVLAGRTLGRGWRLPPAQLHSSHFHSGLLRRQFPAPIDDLNESVGSVSCDIRNLDDGDTSDYDEEESGRHSLDSSPPHKVKASIDPTEYEHDDCMSYECHMKLNGVHLEACGADEVYYGYDRRLFGSKPNSKSNSRSNSRREGFGRLEGRQAQAWKSPHESIYSCEDLGAVEGSAGYHQQDGRGGHPKFSYDRENSSEDESFGDDGSPNERFREAEAALARKGVTRQIAGLRLGRNATAYEHSSPRSRNAEVHCGDTVEDHFVEDSGLRGYSENLGASPSAPPMTGSASIDPNGDTDSHIASFSRSVGQKISYDSEPKYSSFSRLAEPSAAFTIGSEQTKGVAVSSAEQIASSTFANEEEEIGQPTRQMGTSISQPHTIHLSGHAAWQSLIAYDACVRLCLRAWSRGCVEAPEFLLNECSVLRNSFGLQHVLLQPQENIFQKLAAEDAEATTASIPRRDIGKIKVQVRKVRMILTKPATCSIPSLSTSTASIISNIKSALLAGWAAVRKVRISPRQVLQGGFSQRGTAYMQAGAQYMRQVSGLLKAGVNTLRSTSLMDSQETYSCLVRIKSMPDEEAVRMHPGSGGTHFFHPESSGDDLLIEVHDSNGNAQGRTCVQIISLNDDQNDQMNWWSVYSEPDHECVGKIQLYISYTVNSNENSSNKWGPVGENLAYDIALEVAMRVQHFQQRSLRLHGAWKWLLSEFALFYGVSDAYTRLRYLACIMEVATPTEDCLVLIYDQLCPIIKAQNESALNRQEKRMLVDIEDQVDHLLAVAFENYKSLDESSSSGLTEVFVPVGGKTAPALIPAVQIFTLLHDILSTEAQMTLRNYFQAAAKKRCRRHMAETDEFVSTNNEGFLMDTITISAAYSKMRALCMNISNEVRMDIEMHSQHILPSSIDLPNITAGIYSTELCNRLRAFLVACPPSSPSPPVVELLISTADFQHDLTSWNISPFKGGVDAKELFHLYIALWIQDRRLNLLEYCKLDKARWTSVSTPNGTSPFVEEMYDRIKTTLNEYDVLLHRWPEYTFALETAIADVETAVIAALEKQYAEILIPLKDVMVPKKFSLQYMQKLTRRRALSLYSVPNQLGIFLNTIKRLLDTLRPKIETQMKAWVACLTVEGGKNCFGEQLNEVTVLLRAKYKNFLQAIVEKLADNTHLHGTTKLKKILQDTREAGGESEIRDRMQPLNTQVLDTISHLQDVFTTRVFVAICRGYWDKMGQDVLQFLENRKENRSWYKGAYFALLILDDTFASQMQKLQGHALQEKDLEPPRSVMEARSMLSKDALNGSDSSNYFYF